MKTNSPARLPSALPKAEARQARSCQQRPELRNSERVGRVAGGRAGEPREQLERSRRRHFPSHTRSSATRRRTTHTSTAISGPLVAPPAAAKGPSFMQPEVASLRSAGLALVGPLTLSLNVCPECLQKGQENYHQRGAREWLGAGPLTRLLPPPDHKRATGGRLASALYHKQASLAPFGQPEALGNEQLALNLIAVLLVGRRPVA